jgi:hypothetical protein
VSWSLYGQAKPGDVKDAARKAADAQLDAQPFDSWDDDVQAQMDAAFDAAAGLVKTIDSGDGQVSFSLTGHAKQNDSQVDTISVSLSGHLKPQAPTKK